MYVIKGATVYTMGPKGVLEADIRVENGKITGVGPGLAEEGCEVIDAAGLVITPGFVDAHSHIGGFPTGEEIADLNESTNPLTPELIFSRPFPRASPPPAWCPAPPTWYAAGAS